MPKACTGLKGNRTSIVKAYRRGAEVQGSGDDGGPDAPPTNPDLSRNGSATLPRCPTASPQPAKHNSRKFEIGAATWADVVEAQAKIEIALFITQ